MVKLVKRRTTMSIAEHSSGEINDIVVKFDLKIMMAF